MEKIISDKFGCQIIESDGKLFIKFDAGEIAVQFAMFEITGAEAEKAMKSEKDAYEVILDVQARNSGKKG